MPLLLILFELLSVKRKVK